MKGMQDPYQLRDELQAMQTDIQTELLLAWLHTHDVSAADLVVKSNQYFNRPYCPDLVKVSVAEDGSYRQYLQLETSRAGLYDRLPNGLFFQPGSNDFKHTATVPEMVEQYKRAQATEKDTRLFFQPLEQEFYYQGMRLQEEENRLLEGLDRGELEDYFLSFWEIPRVLPAYAASTIVKLIPHAHRINGDLALMENCLAALLRQPVRIEEDTHLHYAAADDELVLGEAALGIDWVCGEAFTDDLPVLVYHIGPLVQSPVSGFLEGGVQAAIIETFNRFFAPMQADISINIHVETGSVNGVLDNADGFLLGFSSIL